MRWPAYVGIALGVAAGWAGYEGWGAAIGAFSAIMGVLMVIEEKLDRIIHMLRDRP